MDQNTARQHAAQAGRGSLSDLEKLLRGIVDGDVLTLDGTVITASAAELNKLDGATLSTAELNKLTGATLSTADLNLLTGIGSNVTITLAASSTADGMDITVQVVDAADAPVEAVHALELWMSENAAGIGLTSATYSGDLTAADGEILSEQTAKKHWTVVTDGNGTFVATLVDTNNPADQFVAVRRPFGARVTVSDASADNWGD